MKTLTQKQKIVACIIAGLLVLLHFGPGMVRSFTQSLSSRRHSAASSPPQLPPPPRQAAAAPAQAITLALSPQLQARYIGIWEGEQFLPNNDHCRVRLELRIDQDKPGYVSGYETRACFNVPAFAGEKNHVVGLADAMRQASPVSTVLTGSPEDGDINFQVDKIIGSSPFQCPHASYAVSSFGQKSIVAQYREVDCPAGQIVLTRVAG